jgi:hypothetical protein
MNEANTDSTVSEKGTRNSPEWHPGVNGVIMILLVLLDIIGIGITDFAPQSSHWYWLAMVIVTGIASIFMEWSYAREKGPGIAAALKYQMLLWLGVLIAVNLVYFMLHSGRLDSENTGLVILLILALATFLAGLRLDRKLCLLGIFMAGVLILATYLEEFLWIVLLVVLAAAAATYFMARHRSAR